jgi:hypothetical protein
MKKPLRIPSIEMQTIAFVDEMRQRRRGGSRHLLWGGFHVYVQFVRTYRNYQVGNYENVFVLHDIDVPERYQRRGWMTYYCRLCWILSDGVFVVANFEDEQVLLGIQRRLGLQRFGDSLYGIR